MDVSQAEALEETLARVRGQVVHDTDFLALRRLNVQSPTVMDVGANKGQSVASLCAVLSRPQIHAFELNPYLHPILEVLADELENLTFWPHGLSDRDGAVEFLVPEIRGQLLLEEASMDPANFLRSWVDARLRSQDPNYRLVPAVGLVRRADELTLPSIDLVKVDVEGAESRVLAGMGPMLERCRPIILAENSDYSVVTGMVELIGYSAYMTQGEALIPQDGPTTNTYYVHPLSPRGMLGEP